MHIMINMKYDENGLPVKGYYTEGNLHIRDKMKAVRNQKYFTGGAIIFMIVVLISTYVMLN